MENRYRLLSDEQWSRLAPIFPDGHLPEDATLPESTKTHSRLALEAVLYLARTGIPWRDLPEDIYGPWDRIYKRWQGWVESGRMMALQEEMLEWQDLPADLDLTHMDSTVVRVHQHGAGAPKKRAGKRPRASGAAGVA